MGSPRLRRRALTASAAVLAVTAAAAVGAAPSDAHYCGRVPPGGYCSSDVHSGTFYGSMYTPTANVPKFVHMFDLYAEGTAHRVNTGCVSYSNLQAHGQNRGTGSHEAWVTLENC